MTAPPIEDCRAGRISPEVAVARLLLAGAAVPGIREAISREPPHPALEAMRRLVDARPAALDGLAAEVAATHAGHSAAGETPRAGVARIAAFFDRAVAHSPEASVALYSLGDPGILASATAEIVGWLEAQGLLRPGMDVLDLGCGIGRIAIAVAPRCRSVLGLDVSPGMVAEARRRGAGLANARFETTSGQDLSALPDGAFDLVLAVDSFPYLVQTGEETASRHVADAARVLRPGGALGILHFSYRDDPALDRADAARWAASCGMRLSLADEAPFRLWDGSATVLRR